MFKNIAQSLLNFAVPILVSQLKGGAAATAAALEAGQPVTLAKITVAPNEHVTVSVQLGA